MDGFLYPYKRKDIASIQEIKQTAGWQITDFFIPDTWQYTRGEGVTIAVIDTGCCLDHPDLVDNLVPGYNIISPEKPPEDDNDHGTHVAGAIAAENNEFGIVGVAPAAKIMPIKVLDSTGSGSMEDVARGIRYAALKNVNLICLSIGCGRPLASLRKAIQLANSKAIPIFCAGGNVQKSMDVLYPARYPETIAVGAIDKTYKRADFSNAAKNNIDFLAPGVDILSTIRNNWYAILSGSSMSVPFVVGVAALALSSGKIKLSSVEDYRTMLSNLSSIDKYQGDKIFSGRGIITPNKLLNFYI